MKQRKRWVALVVVLGLAFLVGGLVGCGKGKDPWEGETGSPRVVVTIPPLYSFVRAVGGDDVAIRCLCTTGPHHYQADSHDARVLARADLLLGIGLRLDDNFADAMRSMVGRADLRYIKLGQRIPENTLMELKHTHHHHHHGEGGHHHHHGKWDPHLWLGLPEAIAMVGVIRDELTAVNEENADVYRKNAEAYINRLKKLHADGKEELKDCKVRRIISFHEALGYLARSFDLEIADVIEQGPGDEPTAGHLAKLVKLCQDPKKPIGAITVEPQYSKSTSANVIERELKAKGVSIPQVEIDPLETAEVKDLEKEGASWYETRMRKNLKALAKALK